MPGEVEFRESLQLVKGWTAKLERLATALKEWEHLLPAVADQAGMN